MTGGDLKIEVLPAGAVVPAFQLLDAVSKGVLDGGHGVLVYHYGKQTALALWGSGPGYAHGRQHAAVLAQVRRRQGTARTKLYASIGANVVSFPYGPMPTQPLGWFKKPITKVDDFKGLKFRTVGISIDVFTGMGAAVNALPGGEIVAAMDRGLLDAAEFNNATSDRILGFADVSKVCMLQSYHQNAEQFEIIVQQGRSTTRCRPRCRRSSPTPSRRPRRTCRGRRSTATRKDYIELQTKDNVKFYKTPDAVLKRQLEIYDEVAKKKAAENPLFKEIVESQLAFAKRATQWEQDTVVSRKMAFDHYFGPEREEADLTVQLNWQSTIRLGDRMVLCCSSFTSHQRRHRMSVQSFLHTIDGISTWVGKAAAWLIIALMTVVCVEVFKRYILNAPTAWIFDADNMLYGSLFMLCGAYTLAQNAHVRGDFLYSSMRPRTQAALDLVLYIVFFIPGIAALIYAGYDYAADSWRIDEHSNVTADGPPVYHFKTVIPIAGALVMLQGIAEIVRCVVCLQTGEWPSRLKDVSRDRRRRGAAGAQRVRRRGSAQDRDRARARDRRGRAPARHGRRLAEHERSGTRPADARRSSWS